MITVVVPVYNVKEYLEKSVGSIRNQTYKNLEIILVDDGSTDGSRELCDKFAGDDKRIRVIHKKNGGLSDARNCGIDNASGEFISFIDSDDYISENMIEKLYMNLISNSADISACGYKMVYPDHVVTICEGEKIQVYSTEESFKFLLHKNNFGVVAWNKLYKRRLLQEIRYPLGKHFEDINTTYKILAVSNKVVYDPAPLYFYMQRSDSINGVNFKSGHFNSRNYDMETAADELISYVYQNQKYLSPDIRIGCLEYYLRVLNQEIIYSVKNERVYKKAKDLSKDMIKDIIKAEYLGKMKKCQMILFDKCYFFYKIFIKLLKR